MSNETKKTEKKSDVSTKNKENKSTSSKKTTYIFNTTRTSSDEKTKFNENF